MIGWQYRDTAVPVQGKKIVMIKSLLLLGELYGHRAGWSQGWITYYCFYCDL